MEKHCEFKSIRVYVKIFTYVILSFMLFGCAPLAPLLLGSGKSATSEDTGFFSRYDDLTSSGSGPDFFGFPDLYSIRSGVNWGAYKKVIVPDFTSLAVNVRGLSALQLTEYKTIKKDLPDQLAQTLDGPVFSQCIRTSERIDPRDIKAIKKLPADAILMGNIKEIASLAPLTVTQVEIKLIDIKTGMEILKFIHRSSTDTDKVAMPIVMCLSVLIDKAKSVKSVESEKTVLPPAPAPTATKLEPTSSEKSDRIYLITVKNSNIRVAPNAKSQILTTIKKGTKIEKISESRDWFKVKLPSGEIGHVYKPLVIVIP